MPFVGPSEDRAAIRELLEGYADAVMRRDASDWAGTWADDEVEWQLDGHPELSSVKGKGAVVDAWTRRMERLSWIAFSMSVGSIVVDGQLATTRSYTSEAYGFDGKTHRAYGRYDDLLVKESGSWRFKVRRLTTIARD